STHPGTWCPRTASGSRVWRSASCCSRPCADWSSRGRRPTSTSPTSSSGSARRTISRTDARDLATHRLERAQPGEGAVVLLAVPTSEHRGGEEVVQPAPTQQHGHVAVVEPVDEHDEPQRLVL